MAKLIKVTYYPNRTSSNDYKHLDFTWERYCNAVEYCSLTLTYYLYIEFKGKQYLSCTIPDYQYIEQEVVDKN